MAAEDFGGKVLDTPIEIVSADHQNKPDIASNIAREWYDTEQVDAIMELTTSSVALAVQGLSKEKKKIDIVTGAATTDLTGKAVLALRLPLGLRHPRQAVGTGGALVKAGGDSWFFLTADYAFGYSLEEQTASSSRAPAARCSARSAIRSPPPTSPRSCCRRRPPAPRSIGLANAGLDTANAIKGAPSSASSPAASGSRRCSSPSPRCTASASRRRRACR